MEKIESKMKEFDTEDHQDILTMFERVDREKLNEDMQLFWEAKRMTLSRKNSKGHRWHPK